MMLVLECSTSFPSVALVEDGKIWREISVEAPRGRGGAIFTALDELLREAGPLSRVVAGIGPGSYNGIRTALAAGWGIAAARNVPVQGISSLLGLGEGNYRAVGDARRGQYYYAEVQSGAFIQEPLLLEREMLERYLAEEKESAERPIFASTPLEFLPGVEVRFPSAGSLGIAAARKQFVAGNMPEPMYLKPAYINLSPRKD